MNWKIKFTKSAQSELDKLDMLAKQRIERFLDQIPELPSGPRMKGESLHGPMAGLWKYRVGDYRLICELEDEVLIVLVVWLGHRRDVYEILRRKRSF